MVKNKTMEITQINNLSNDIYHNSEKYKEYWSSSNLKVYDETPKEAYYQKFLAKPKEIQGAEFGSAFHDFLASKHVSGQPFEWNEFEPPINKTTGKPYAKGTKAYDESLSQIINPISSDDMQLINDIWQMMKSSDYAWYLFEKILNQGIAEPSFFVKGLHKYKYRPDVLTDTLITDWKTATKAFWSESRLMRRMFSLGYHITAAMYQYFEHLRTGIWKRFIIVWILKDPPFDILIDDISRFAFEPFGDNEVIPNEGAKLFLKLKDQHEACQLANYWPGIANKYPLVNGVRMADYMSYSYEKDYKEFEIDNEKF